MRLCSIASGSSGNCIYVGDDSTHLLVDTGISKKRVEQGLLELTDLDGETLAKIMYPQSAEFLNKVSERDEAEREEILLFLAGYLSGGSEEGKTYYEGFLHELDGGFRAGDLTAGGRAAWERLRDFVSRFAASAEPEA